MSRHGLGRSAARLLVLAVVCEVVSYAAIAVLNQRAFEPIRRTSVTFREQTALLAQLLEQPPRHPQRLDPDLGWVYGPSFVNAEHQLNAAGMRAAREYPPVPAHGTVRVAAVGASFVYGSGEPNATSWPALLEAHAGMPLEVLNFGVPGYGTDQAYLRFRRDVAQWKAHVVLVGATATDMARNVSVYRRFFSVLEPPVFKPRFLLRDAGDLRLLPAPLKTVADYEVLRGSPRSVLAHGAHDYFYEPLIYANPLHDYSATVRLGTAVAYRVRRRYVGEPQYYGARVNPRSESFQLQTQLLARLVREVRESGAEPIVLLLPDDRGLAERLAGRPEPYEPLRDYLATAGIEFLNGADAFAAASPELRPDWFNASRHYSAAGGRILADWLAGQLRDRVDRVLARTDAR